MKLGKLMVGCVIVLTAAQTAPAASLDALRTSYSNASVKIAADTQKQKDDALAQYGRSLAIVQAALKQKGDIDNYMVVEQEFKRIQTDKTVLTNTPGLLIANVINAYQKQVLAVDLHSARRKADLLNRYIPALGNLVRDLMAKNKIVEAKAAGDEKKAAEFVLAETESMMPKADVPKSTEVTGIVIVKAVYGPIGSGIDVTDKMRALVKDDGLEIPGGLNSVFGDVAPQRQKVLVLDYTIGTELKKVVHKVYGENDPVIISTRGAATAGDKVLYEEKYDRKFEGWTKGKTLSKGQFISIAKVTGKIESPSALCVAQREGSAEVEIQKTFNLPESARGHKIAVEAVLGYNFVKETKYGSGSDSFEVQTINLRGEKIREKRLFKNSDGGGQSDCILIGTSVSPDENRIVFDAAEITDAAAVRVRFAAKAEESPWHNPCIAELWIKSLKIVAEP